jgi:hypothetical protein
MNWFNADPARIGNYAPPQKHIQYAVAPSTVEIEIYNGE